MQLRKATVADVEAIQNLINRSADSGLMLPRSLAWLYENLRDFTVAVDDAGLVVGAGALHVVWNDLAEVRSLAVDEPLRGHGVGRALVENMQAETGDFGIGKVFALTYQPDFFRKVGFHQVEKEALPHKVWRDCLDCVKFPNCDEIAMVWEK